MLGLLSLIVLLRVVGGCGAGGCVGVQGVVGGVVVDAGAVVVGVAFSYP